jgi:subtilase family serine protease
VAESRETNNTAARPITIGADLSISFFSGPTSAQAGGTATVSDTTLNRGGDTAAPSTTAFYLSVNRTVEPGDVVLGSRAVPGLGAGVGSTASTVLTIPNDTAPGSYYVVFQADDGNVVAEALETNNAVARAIQVTAAP